MTDPGMAPDRLAAVLLGLAHGLKRPLSAVLLSSDILQNRGLSEEDVTTLAAGITVSAREAVALSDDLVDLLRLEAGQWVLAPESLDVAALLRSLVADPAPTDVALDAPTDQPFEAVADRTGLERLLRCLLVQLIGATPPDGRIRFAFSTHPHRLDLSIHTTARAAGETLESVFEPFAPVLGPPGLAFVLARRLAESQGGGLVATGRDDEGTTFLLSLPRPGPILQDRLSRQAAGRQRQRRP